LKWGLLFDEIREGGVSGYCYRLLAARSCCSSEGNIIHERLTFCITVTPNTELHDFSLPSINHSLIYASIAIEPFLGSWPLLQFSNRIRSPYNSLDCVSALRKTGNYTTPQKQTKRTQTNCLEWDSNPRSQCSSVRRQFMP
jgi:hypothetical protein